MHVYHGMQALPPVPGLCGKGKALLRPYRESWGMPLDKEWLFELYSPILARACIQIHRPFIPGTSEFARNLCVFFLRVLLSCGSKRETESKTTFRGLKMTRPCQRKRRRVSMTEVHLRPVVIGGSGRLFRTAPLRRGLREFLREGLQSASLKLLIHLLY